MKELNLQEQVFVFEYVKTLKVYQSAIRAGYADSYAKTKVYAWVSETQCPRNKLHVREAIRKELNKIYAEEKIDKGWILRRAKLLAEFSISKFIRQEGGEAVYDFSNATPDDWWCVEEYVTEETLSDLKASGGEPLPAGKVKKRIKTPSKIQALKLLGDHVDVAAFKDHSETSGQVTHVHMSQDEYKKAREQAIRDDDC